MILGWVQVETYNRDSGAVKSKVLSVSEFQYHQSRNVLSKYADPFQLLQLQYLLTIILICRRLQKCPIPLGIVNYAEHCMRAR